ncbi:MAG: hypothetical protein EBU46_01370 [Nitrosomonadaceae bacterium]|nr:hypothetical protein [Nitrosomonadaceae bacterium]
MTEITWINCADEMPPDDETHVIMRLSNPVVIQVAKGNQINHIYSKIIPNMWEWTPYTDEKWKELNK